MIRVQWELEEAVALFDVYFKNGASLSIPEEKLSEISKAYHNRANQLGLVVDEKFRNEPARFRKIADDFHEKYYE